MNSISRSPMVAAKYARLFSEFKLHLRFPIFPLELAKPRPLVHGRRRLLAGMLTAIGGHPVPSAFVNADSFATLAIGRDVSITIFTARLGSVEALLRSGQLINLSKAILMDGLSGRLGAPHGSFE